MAMPAGLAVDKKHNIYFSDVYCNNVATYTYDSSADIYVSMKILAGYKNVQV